MRRVLTFLVLASFATGPAMRVPCLFACAEAQRAEATASCHADAASGPAFTGAHGCPADGLAITLAVKRAGVVAPVADTLIIETSHTPQSPDVAAAAALGLDPAAPGPPLLRCPIPLRI